MKRTVVLLIAAGLVVGCADGAEDGDIARGQQVFAEHCVSCHSVSPEVIIVGPALAGVATRAAANNENLEPREVLRRSILKPQAAIVEGFADLMPPDFEQKLTETDLEALISYLLTLE